MSAAAAAAKSLQSCLTLCDPIDSSPQGSPVLGILQARRLVGPCGHKELDMTERLILPLSRRSQRSRRPLPFLSLPSVWREMVPISSWHCWENFGLNQEERVIQTEKTACRGSK